MSNPTVLTLSDKDGNPVKYNVKQVNTAGVVIASVEFESRVMDGKRSEVAEQLKTVFVQSPVSKGASEDYAPALAFLMTVAKNNPLAVNLTMDIVADGGKVTGKLSDMIAYVKSLSAVRDFVKKYTDVRDSFYVTKCKAVSKDGTVKTADGITELG